MGEAASIIAPLIGLIGGNDAPQVQTPDPSSFMTPVQKALQPLLQKIAENMAAQNTAVDNNLQTNKAYFARQKANYQQGKPMNATDTKIATAPKAADATTGQTQTPAFKPNDVMEQAAKYMQTANTPMAGTGFNPVAPPSADVAKFFASQPKAQTMAMLDAYNRQKQAAADAEALKSMPGQQQAQTPQGQTTTPAQTEAPVTPQAPNRMITNGGNFTIDPNSESSFQRAAKDALSPEMADLIKKIKASNNFAPQDGRANFKGTMTGLNGVTSDTANFAPQPPNRMIAPPQATGSKSDAALANLVDNGTGDSTQIAYNNPDNMAPITPTDYSGQMVLPDTPEGNMIKQKLLETMQANPNIKSMDEAMQMLKASAAQPNPYMDELHQQIANKEAFRNALYEQSADPLRREAARIQQQNQADLAARGLGNSTIVNDVNGQTQRELLANLGDLSNKATTGSTDMANQILTNLANFQNQNQDRQFNAATSLAGLAGQKQGLTDNDIANLQKQLNVEENRRIFNIQMPYTEQRNRVNDYFNRQNSILGIANGQTPIMNAGVNIGTTNAQMGAANATANNNLIGDVMASAMNLGKNKQTSVPVTYTQQTTPTVTGGLSGALLGGSLGSAAGRTNNLFNLH